MIGGFPRQSNGEESGDRGVSPPCTCISFRDHKTVPFSKMHPLPIKFISSRKEAKVIANRHSTTTTTHISTDSINFPWILVFPFFVSCNDFTTFSKCN